MNSELKLFGGTSNAPEWLPASEIARCKTYREAVRLSWAHRRVKGMTKQVLSSLIEAYPSHVTDYLNGDDLPSRRDLPAKSLNSWASAVGNWGVQQWMAQQAELHFMEEMIQRRAA